MASYSKRHSQASEKNKDEAMKITLATQKPGQTKAQSKLIAQGIQKGIEHYKKQHKARSRDLNKQIKSVTKSKSELAEREVREVVIVKQSWLPWGLLIASWLAFIVFVSAIIL